MLDELRGTNINPTVDSMAELERQRTGDLDYESRLRAQAKRLANLEDLMLRDTAKHSQELQALSTLCGDLKSELAHSQMLAEERLTEVRALRASLSNIELERNSLAGLLDRVRMTMVFRVLRKAGLWGWLEPAAAETTPLAPALNPKKTLERVVVDLTPVLPGGENGGAKVMTLELIRQLARLAPSCEFILLTAESSHNELASLDAANVKRICLSGAAAPVCADETGTLRKTVGKVFPRSVQEKLEEAQQNRAIRHNGSNGIVKELEADLLFCPFTAPYYFDPGVPLVGVVYDLQHIYYPAFFTSIEIHNRDRDFKRLCRLSSRVICISDFVRKTILENSEIEARRVQTVHILLPHRLQRSSPEEQDGVCQDFGLERNGFLLYPANFWPHKNHPMLLTAFGMYRKANPGSTLKLVLTGSPGESRDEIMEASLRMGLESAVIFPGYLTNERFGALMDASMALIFPSLFEGFGMPLVEAMAAGKPLLVSNTTSLPEVGGDSALYFDPRRPTEVVAAISKIAESADFRSEMAERSRNRLNAFSNAEAMAASYLKIFQEAIANPAALPAGVYGAFEDGWLGKSATVVLGSSSQTRELLLRLELPGWSPLPEITVTLAAGVLAP